MDNYKGFIIFGKDDENGKYQDGQIIMFGDSKSDDLHIENLLSISKEYFPEDSILSRLTIRHQPEMAAFFIVNMGNIVFLNTTKYNENNISKYGKSGMLMLPNTLSANQASLIEGIGEQLENYDLIIKTDLKLNEGFLESKTLTCMDKVVPKQLMKLVQTNCSIVENGKRY